MHGGTASGLLTAILGAIGEFLSSLAGRWQDLNAFIVGQLGPVGQWAFWAASALFICIFVAYATGFVFKILRWVILPAAALSIAALTLAPSFPATRTFPVFLGLTSLVMMVKGR